MEFIDKIQNDWRAASDHQSMLVEALKRRALPGYSSIPILHQQMLHQHTTRESRADCEPSRLLLRM
jgi:hypothetical protein